MRDVCDGLVIKDMPYGENDRLLTDMYIDLVCTSKEENELSEMAADVIASGDGSVVGILLDRYESATEYSFEAI